MCTKCRFLLHDNFIVNDRNMNFNGSIYGTSVHQKAPFYMLSRNGHLMTLLRAIMRPKMQTEVEHWDAV